MDTTRIYAQRNNTTLYLLTQPIAPSPINTDLLVAPFDHP